ncbi:MAG: hypothetical protein K2P94_05715 [Rhodospirillaceae bacterium]|nr:hypothetical protein [Rhodospirillaceae bacterium]
MKRIIVIVLVLMLVAGGTGGGLIMLGIVPNPFNPKVPERVLTAAEKAAAEMEKKNKFVPPQAEFKLVKMADMVVPVIIDGKAERRVMLIARLVAASNEDKKIVEAGMPRFQDEMLKDLVPHFQTYFLKHDMIDILDIKARLMKHAKTVFGERVKDVLLVNAFEQNNNRIK